MSYVLPEAGLKFEFIDPVNFILSPEASPKATPLVLLNVTAVVTELAPPPL